MNYHILVDDKFCPTFINDIRAIDLSNENKFIIRKHGDLKFINSTDKATVVNNNVDDLLFELMEVQNGDKVIFHWFDNIAGEIARRIKCKCLIYAVHWGGDFFIADNPFLFKYLYDEKTKGYVKKKLGYSYINIRNTYSMMKKWLIAYKKYKLKTKQVAAIDRILIHPLNQYDIDLTKKIYKGSRFSSIPFFYSNVLPQMSIYPPKSINKGKVKILLGNSATETNNHFEAIDKFVGLNNIEINCLLSYGNNEYRQELIEYGKEKLGENFIPILDYLPNEKYLKFLNEMDIFFMFHNRSQAFNTILYGLFLNKYIFIKDENSIYKLLESIGVNVYNANKFNFQQLDMLISDNNKFNFNEQYHNYFSEKVYVDFLHQFTQKFVT